MMRSKLRVVHERTVDVPVENDLRGLGDPSLFQDMTPEPVLTVNRSTLSFADLATRLDLTEQVPDSNGRINIICTKSGLTHKEKAIHLFAFALNLRVIANMDCVLWERHRLKEALSASMETEVKGKTGNPAPHQVTISAGIQLHLRQAGFSLDPSSENQVLSDTSVRQFYSEMVSSSSAKVRSHKAG
jgi:hypothetical protein